MTLLRFLSLSLALLMTGCATIWVRDCEYLDGEFPTLVYSWVQFCDGDRSGTPCGKCRRANKKDAEDAQWRAKVQCHPGTGKRVKDDGEQDFSGGCTQ